MRCPDCGQLVVWMPPRHAGDLVSVECACGRRITEIEQWTVYRRTLTGWEGVHQSAIDVVAEIETGRRSVMTVDATESEGKTA
jgi:hypothetical protein